MIVLGGVVSSSALCLSSFAVSIHWFGILILTSGKLGIFFVYLFVCFMLLTLSSKKLLCMWFFVVFVFIYFLRFFLFCFLCYFLNQFVLTSDCKWMFFFFCLVCLFVCFLFCFCFLFLFFFFFLFFVFCFLLPLCSSYRICGNFIHIHFKWRIWYYISQDYCYSTTKLKVH